MKQRKLNWRGSTVPPTTIRPVMPVKVGDIVRKAPVSFSLCDCPGAHPPPQSGRVAWVHPEGRYYLVEFPVGAGVIRECFGGVCE